MRTPLIAAIRLLNPFGGGAVGKPRVSPPFSFLAELGQARAKMATYFVCALWRVAFTAGLPGKMRVR
jgi:hypothetical protein